MKKIAVFTGTRAEYGLLYWLMKDIQEDTDLELQILATAMHYSPEHGETWKAIVKDGFKITESVEMLLSSDTSSAVVKSMGVGLIGFADALKRMQPDLLIVLGDRFEALAVTQAALIMQIPVAHLHGGEITEGAYDESIRHAITKMATIHFAAAEPYQKRIIQLGEHPDKVFNVGAVGLDHIQRTQFRSVNELSEIYEFDFSQPYLLITYHPETNLKDEDVSPLFKALKARSDINFIFSYPNADNGNTEIVKAMLALKEEMPNRVLLVKSFGIQNYLSVLNYSLAMVGNSSSGLSEAPALQVPTVNIGNRQKGRLRCDSILDVALNEQEIQRALQSAIEFPKDKLNQIVPPLGLGNTSKKIIDLIKNTDFRKKAPFYDL
ncbi:UDP-N-acetylglucosamine 2-epimerase (hydrolyzing) [Acinetobacter sp. RIT698]|uniref:UDP-N-acetylglucosamine 2-epimerase n=1 Tax=Acinetobacter sp. RIT698 TaxID=2666192 RepID=UPI0012ACF23A|nr:UDP-N-acetylglucosamine 2-epimerase [Acinetobacter sp. RIT698]MRT37995.1 UDP-N-acetylglucosamine 2-epimerase (hydrolyzing) [Acinetobacter sp. RIT698]